MIITETVVRYIDPRTAEFGHITGITLFAIIAIVLIGLVDNFWNRNKYNK